MKGREPAQVAEGWVNGSFRCASEPSRPARGLLRNGLALTKLWRGSPKGRRPPAWRLTHIGTGHAICQFEARDPFRFASAIAAAGDWEFSGLGGYKNLDPDLPRKVREVILSFKGVRVLAAGGNPNENAACEVAREMAG